MSPITPSHAICSRNGFEDVSSWYCEVGLQELISHLASILGGLRATRKLSRGRLRGSQVPSVVLITPKPISG